MVIKVYYQNPNTPYEALSKLVREAFEERTNAGMHFSCANFSAQELQSHTENSYIFVAYDDEAIVGMSALTIKDRYSIHYGTSEFVSTANNYKGKGVASLLFKSLLRKSVELDLDFLTSTTAVEAKSSVRYHLKNGFKIFRYVSYPDTSYYSYCFIIPMKKMKVFNVWIIRKFVFWGTFFSCRLFYRPDGSLRFKGKKLCT